MIKLHLVYYSKIVHTWRLWHIQTVIKAIVIVCWLSLCNTNPLLFTIAENNLSMVHQKYYVTLN